MEERIAAIEERIGRPLTDEERQALIQAFERMEADPTGFGRLGALVGVSDEIVQFAMELAGVSQEELDVEASEETEPPKDLEEPIELPGGEALETIDEVQFFLENQIEQLVWIYRAGVNQRVGVEELADMYDSLDTRLQNAVDSFGGGGVIEALLGDMEEQGFEISEEQVKAQKMAAWLAHLGPENDDSMGVVQEWALDNGMWAAPRTINGIEEERAVAWAQNLGVTPERASLVLRAAESKGLDEAIYAVAWRNARERSQVDPTISREPDDEIPEVELERSDRRVGGGAGRSAQSRHRSRVRVRNREARKLDVTLAEEMKELVTEFGEGSILPIVAMENRALAQRLLSDPYSLTSAEAFQVLEMLGDVELLIAESPGLARQVEWLEQQARGRVIEVPVNRTEVVDAARTLMNAWNLNLSDQFLENLAAGYMTEVVNAIKANLMNPFRDSGSGTMFVETRIPSARDVIEQRLRGTEEYRIFQSRRQPGESEEEFVQRMTSASLQQLGEENPDAIRAAQAAGDPSAVTGRAIATGQAFRAPGFQRRLAALGEVLREFT